MGWGPVDWVGRVLPEAKFKNKWTLFFLFLFLNLSDRYWDICKNSVWGPVEWVGDQLTGWGGSYQKQNSKINWCFFISFFWATHTEISVKNSFWGPVEWVGDQLTGWGGSSQKQNSKINGLCFLKFFNLSDHYWDITKKRFLGTSWMGWGPVDWVGGGPPGTKIWK